MTPRFPLTLRDASHLPARALLLTLLLAMFALSGCSSIKGIFGKDKEAYEGVPVEQLYAKGHTLMERANYNGALNVYKRLIAQYPYGPYTEQALVETAYAQFKSGSNDDAISTIDRFIRT